MWRIRGSGRVGKFGGGLARESGREILRSRVGRRRRSRYVPCGLYQPFSGYMRLTKVFLLYRTSNVRDDGMRLLPRQSGSWSISTMWSLIRRVSSATTLRKFWLKAYRLSLSVCVMIRWGTGSTLQSEPANRRFLYLQIKCSHYSSSTNSHSHCTVEPIWSIYRVVLATITIGYALSSVRCITTWSDRRCRRGLVI